MKLFLNKFFFFILLFTGSAHMTAMHRNNLEQVLEYELARNNLAITMFEPEINNPEQSFEARQTARRMLEIVRENSRLAHESLNELRRIRERNRGSDSVEPEDSSSIRRNMQLLANNQSELENLNRRFHRPAILKKIVSYGTIIGIPIIGYAIYKWWNKKSDEKKKKPADAKAMADKKEENEAKNNQHPKTA